MESFSQLEEQVLKRWKETRAFEKSVARRKGGKRFVFYDGPPTANAAPGFHHGLNRVYKDVILRYKTMRGFFVPRRAGWDTHGLPVELQVEKKLGLKSKKDIEKYGIARFNEECRKSVWEYQQEWERFNERMGFWIDMENPYVTYRTSYMESLWSIIAQWYRKGLLQKDYKVVPYCPRCGTPLSSHELGLGYKTVQDTSVYVRFPVVSKDKEWKDTSVLSWTTTPWTLPGNVALAVNPKLDYVCVPDPEQEGHWLVLGLQSYRQLVAKGMLKAAPKGKQDVFKGREMVGIGYRPPFDVPELRSSQAHQVYPADFVAEEEGTGVVHTAVMYGEDDYRLGKELGLPQRHTVDGEGRFNDLVPAWKGTSVKEAEPGLVSDLENRGLLFETEPYEHEYPHCWRCDTPLLYYAKESWFVAMTKVKKELLANNQKIHWVPSHIKDGRMGEWLSELKDWAFSRERYWGTTLPLWECAACKNVEAVGSLAELASRAPLSNTYYLLRHGHSDKQVTDEVISWPEPKRVSLTAQGRREADRAAEKLKEEQIDVIYSSDLLRTKQTADIAGKATGAAVTLDPRLRDLDAGIYNGKKLEELAKIYREPGETPFQHYMRRFVTAPPKGENWVDVQKRVWDFVQDLEKRHAGKRVLVVSHEVPLTMLQTLVSGLSREETVRFRMAKAPKTGEARKISGSRYPYNARMELDLHRPYADEITFPCSHCRRGVMRRVKEVADVWFDSGSMPFASVHWPFERGQKEHKPPELFPADYIVEAVDQTRGWFYTLLACSTALGFGVPYRNVISLGHILDEKGEKMSKSKGNIVDPWAMAAAYGADAMRWYFYTVNHPGDSKLFLERELAEAQRRFVRTLWNSVLFYETYAPKGTFKTSEVPRGRGANVLDRWILSRLSGAMRGVTDSLDAYSVTDAARALEGFVVRDLSLWYIRRSRPRLQNPATKQEELEAAATLQYVLAETIKLAAPFVPFLAEETYVRVVRKKRGSVHWEDWPFDSRPLAQGRPSKDRKLEKDMERVRELVTKALAERAREGIRVRQPLALLQIPKEYGSLSPALLSLLAQEVNVREVVADEKATSVKLDTRITPELKEEGQARELMRHMQELRREAGYKPQDRAVLRYSAGKPLALVIARRKKEFMKGAGLRDLLEGKRAAAFDAVKEVTVEGIPLWLALKRA